MSRRRDSGSIAGSCDHRSMSTSTERGSRPRGTRSATGLPLLETHGQTAHHERLGSTALPPPWLRSSRIDIFRHLESVSAPVIRCEARPRPPVQPSALVHAKERTECACVSGESFDENGSASRKSGDTTAPSRTTCGRRAHHAGSALDQLPAESGSSFVSFALCNTKLCSTITNY